MEENLRICIFFLLMQSVQYYSVHMTTIGPILASVTALASRSTATLLSAQIDDHEDDQNYKNHDGRLNKGGDYQEEEEVVEKGWSCSCTKFKNSQGYGDCKKQHPKEGIICYVKRPSNCGDLKQSITDRGKFTSAAACYPVSRGIFIDTRGTGSGIRSKLVSYDAVDGSVGNGRSFDPRTLNWMGYFMNATRGSCCDKCKGKYPGTGMMDFSESDKLCFCYTILLRTKPRTVRNPGTFSAMCDTSNVISTDLEECEPDIFLDVACSCFNFGTCNIRGICRQDVGCIPECTPDAIITEQCNCKTRCLVGALCKGGTQCMQACQDGMSINATCHCNGNNCLKGSKCFGGKCLAACEQNVFLTAECWCFFDKCNIGGKCTTEKWCVPGCPTDQKTTRPCYCKENYCYYGVICKGGKTCWPACRHGQIIGDKDCHCNGARCGREQMCFDKKCVAGNQGNTGNTGNTVNPGSSGNLGNTGDTGNTGNQGNIDNTGDTVNPGSSGNQGNLGDTGNTGNQGNIDNTGDIVNPGSSGNPGNLGNTGDTGNTDSQNNAPEETVPDSQVEPSNIDVPLGDNAPKEIVPGPEMDPLNIHQLLSPSAQTDVVLEETFGRGGNPGALR